VAGADIGARSYPQPTHQPGTQVRDDVPIKIGGYYYVKLLGPEWAPDNCLTLY
jgi:hypothetical protein